LRLEGVNA